MRKTFTDDKAEYMTQSATHPWLSIDCWTCELRSDKNSYRRPCSVDRTVGEWRRTSKCLFVTACSMDEYAEEKRTEKNLIIRSGISEAETTNNKRLRSTFCIEAIQTRSIARPLCDSRAFCYSIRCSTFTQTPKRSKEIDQRDSISLRLIHRPNH